MSAKNKSITEKTSELSQLIAWFDSSDYTIEAAVDKFKEAEKLAVEIEKDLSILKNEINIVKQKFDNEA